MPVTMISGWERAGGADATRPLPTSPRVGFPNNLPNVFK